MNTDFESLQLYLSALKAIKPLPPEVMKELWTLSKTDKRAFDKIFEQNYRLVIPIAKRFMRKGIELMDLIEEGNLGLMKAVEKFDVTKGVAFSTYAVFWIEEYVRKAVEYQLKTIKIPSHIWDALNLRNKTKAMLREQFNRTPTDYEIVKKLKLNKKQADQLRRFFMVFNGPCSLETPISEESNIQLKDIISDISDKSPESFAEITKTEKDIILASNNLSERERKIICMRFGLCGKDILSLYAIGRIFHISEERVRQIELGAFKKLRSILAKYMSPQELEKLNKRKETILCPATDRRFNAQRKLQWI
jgi:RNA polymerase primary sigma factor